MQPELTGETVAIATLVPIAIYMVGGLIVNGQLFRLLKSELPGLWRELGEPHPLRGVKDPRETAKLRVFLSKGQLPDGASDKLKEAHAAAKMLAKAQLFLMMYVLATVFVYFMD